MAKKRYNITAIIYDKRGRVLSVGKNSYLKTHPLQQHHANAVGLTEKIYIHAEVHAIVKCKNLDKAHSIRVFRFDSNGEPMNAKPCIVCQSAIKESGIEHVYHI